MDDDAKNKLKMVLAAIAVIVAVGLAIRSGIRAQTPPMHVVGHLGGNMQGPATPVTNTNGTVTTDDNPNQK
jgi:hypothetical protein